MIQIPSDEKRDCETRLRKVVIHSADVLPEEVSVYLTEVSKHGSWDAKRAVLTEYRPLIDHLPKEYVNFALDVLIKKPRKPRGPLWQEDDPLDKLGIEDDLQYFPPAHVQGPFLYLLQKHEDEGLRLIHTLVNSAVQRWCEREQRPRYRDKGRTPLPIVINLPSGPQEFWGDEQVYYWYRPNSVGPAPLVSALMALEVWMEQQIEAEREPEELFQKVLSGSRCVAALGICLGIALAYPEKCLKAALPLVSSSAVWLMDVKRVSADASKSFDFSSLGRHRHIYKLVAERDERPQRSQDVRSLAVYYVLAGDESLRVPFERAVARFTEELPFLYQEERESPEAKAYLREKMETFQIFGDRANYRLQQVENRMQIRIEPPEHIRVHNEAILARIDEQGRWYSVDMWARKTVEQAVAFAKEFQQPADFSTPYEMDEQSNYVLMVRSFLDQFQTLPYNSLIFETLIQPDSNSTVN